MTDETERDAPRPGAAPETDADTDREALEAASPAGEAAESRAYDEPKKIGIQAKIVVTVLVMVALFALFWPRGDGSFEAPGGFLTDAGGQPQTLGPRMAPVTLVHFWATWCPPCLTEIPALDRLMDDFANQRDFQVLMVAVQDDIDKVETFLGADAAFVLYDHNWDVAHRYGTRKLPETYLVVDGQVVKRWEGAQNWDEADIRQLLRESLGQVNPQQRDHGGDIEETAAGAGG